MVRPDTPTDWDTKAMDGNVDVEGLRDELEAMRVRAAVATCTAKLAQMELRNRPRPISHDPLEGYASTV